MSTSTPDFCVGASVYAQIWAVSLGEARQGGSLQPCLGKLHHPAAKDEVICCQTGTQGGPETQLCLCGGHVAPTPHPHPRGLHDSADVMGC